MVQGLWLVLLAVFGAMGSPPAPWMLVHHELVCKYEYLYFSWYIQQLKLHHLELIITGKFNHSTWSQFSTWSNSLFASWFNLASNLFNLPSSLILLWYPYSLSWPVCNAATVWTACQPHPAFRGYMFDWWMIAFVWIIVTCQLLGFGIQFINTIIKKNLLTEISLLLVHVQVSGHISLT